MHMKCVIGIGCGTMFSSGIYVYIQELASATATSQTLRNKVINLYSCCLPVSDHKQMMHD